MGTVSVYKQQTHQEDRIEKIILSCENQVVLAHLLMSTIMTSTNIIKRSFYQDPLRFMGYFNKTWLSMSLPLSSSFD